MQSTTSVLLSDRPVLHALARNWWLVLLRGLAAIAFGAVALSWPGLTLLTLILLFGVYVLTDGVIAIVAAIVGGASVNRGWLAIVGILGIAVGVLTLMLPGMTTLILLFTMAGWAVAIGVLPSFWVSRAPRYSASSH